MAAATWFWLIYVLFAILAGFFGWRSSDRFVMGVIAVVFILVGILGWSVFGAPIK